jgi:phage shock protein PspC (stress-responsive transcriptional regulator)
MLEVRWDGAWIGHDDHMSDDMNGSGSGSAGPGESGGPDGFGSSGGAGGFGGKKLERKLNDRWLAGVCAGLSDYSGIDVSLIRVIFAVLTLFGGTGAIAYVLAWALIPEEGEKSSIAEKFISKTGS